jgi:hypothetical protein
LNDAELKVASGGTAGPVITVTATIENPFESSPAGGVFGIGSGLGAFQVPMDLDAIAQLADALENQSEESAQERVDEIVDQAAAVDQPKLADQLIGAANAINSLVNELGEDKKVTIDGKDITLGQLSSSIGNTLAAIETGILVQAAINNEPYLVDTAGFLIALGVTAGVGALGGSPLVVFAAATAASEGTKLALNEIDESLGISSGEGQSAIIESIRDLFDLDFMEPDSFDLFPSPGDLLRDFLIP